MINEMRNAVQGALKQERRFEVLTNHLANANTAGFKTQDLSFDDMLQANMAIDFSQGTLHPTGSPLDLAINGDGFFKIETPQGVRYTRNGSFTIDQDGTLVTGNGYPVLGEAGPIAIDGEDVQVDETGGIHVDGSKVGQLGIVTFEHPHKFAKQGESLLVYNGPVSDEREFSGAIEQGSLEQSNVATVREMTKMVETSRYYESFQKLMQTIDEMDAKAIGEVGQVR